jgi:alginate O-acetyltransferase complex protein AlgI
MLFNSFPFLFVFLPLTLAGMFLLVRRREFRLIAWYIGFVSLIFYAYWNPIHLFVIVPSIVVNFLCGKAIVESERAERRRLYMWLGVVFDLVLLGWFKYAPLLAQTFASRSVTEFTSAIVNPALPIGISFYTFLQIAYLVDCRKAAVAPRYTFRDYLFFVTFFPHLIAGPILHHAAIIPQLKRIERRFRADRYWALYFAPGLTLLIMGLMKKVLIADTFGGWSDQSFAAIQQQLFGFLDAWGGVLAYTFQIYFDFSAYSDMAIGLGLMFGIVLPKNFLSPYKAGSIIEFWRRWHVTLSRFLRDYLYIPLGGNRDGKLRRYVNLMITMALGGLWHGASWSFMLWGMLHGALLVVNHAARRLFPWQPPRALAVAITFIVIVFTWVPFRAANISDTMAMWEHMIGLHGIVLPWRYAWLAAPLGLKLGDVNYFAGMSQILFTAAAGCTVFFLPNSVELVTSRRARLVRSGFAPVALGAGFVAACLVMLVSENVTFLYFQF